ncbi:(d)CMP kinase [Neisseriaceae bacterium TC5R-5]|nr:(d)CMP kinase [Neisseriaceae bacterium TC5R-5]
MTTPIITIDGPSASGKGTIAAIVAHRLGFHYLDSGSLYRLLALHTRQQSIAWDDETRVAAAAISLPAKFIDGHSWLNGKEVSATIRAEHIGNGASQIAALPAVRAALLQRQRDFCAEPGLVTDGRDMGSIVFPMALLKIFLTASQEERAERRYKQLINKGESANLPQIKLDIINRDVRDATRSIAPLRHESDALLLDTTQLNVDQAVEKILMWFQEKQAS